MRFSLLAHSCLWLEHAGTSVLVDPWLAGPAYDGAWELLPAAAEVAARLPRPDWILLSHGHPDHFHLPTLAALAARFGRDLGLLVPQQALPYLRHAALQAGFTAVREVPLEREMQLGPGLSVWITAARADDSVQVFRAGAITLVNANDCRLDDRLRRRLARQVAAPDFHLGQFSAADAYPFALEGFDEGELAEAAALPARLLLEDARALGAKVAIPIGGFVRFAHAENAWMNRWRTAVAAVGGAGDPRVEVLYPGDAWSTYSGFERLPVHRLAYEDGERALREGALPCAASAPAPPAAEIETAAAQRFGALCALLPAMLRRRIGRLGFHLEDTGACLVVDFAARSLAWGAGAPDAPHYALRAAHFTHTCRSPWGWSDFHIAGRFRVRRWRESTAVETFLPASILSELPYLGCERRELVRRRALRAFWLRRGEIAAGLWRLTRGDRGVPGSFARL